jgi:hypothetical protein
MKKNLKEELNEMKFLFGYKPGRVISEQDMPKDMAEDMDVMDDELDLMDDEVTFAEPEVAPAPTREREKTRETEKEKPFDPARRERDPSRLPYTDPDTHPQGEGEHYDEESEPYSDTVSDFESDSALEELVMKYLNNRS